MNLADSRMDCLRGCLANLSVLKFVSLEAFKMYYVMRASAT